MLFFVTKKKKSTQTGFACNFLQPLMQMCRGPYIPFFKINAPIFCCPLFFEEYLNPQDHPLIFLWTRKECISAEYFLNFFSNLYLLPWLRKQAPRWRGEGKGTCPPLFMKPCFSRYIFLEICICVILQGIQNFSGPGTPKVSNLWC